MPLAYLIEIPRLTLAETGEPLVPGDEEKASTSFRATRCCFVVRVCRKATA